MSYMRMRTCCAWREKASDEKCCHGHLLPLLNTINDISAYRKLYRLTDLCIEAACSGTDDTR
jgi:hypothetical protein